MKHIFIINPIAGKGSKSLAFLPVIQDTCRMLGLDYEFYITKAKYEAIDFIRENAASGEQMRIYACGGDGTLFEVVNGAYGFENVEITLLPFGSGNDFLRYFGATEDFLNLENLINGEVVEIDLIKCGDKYSINQCSMGLDAEIGGMQEKFKKIPFISGASAYYPAIFYGLMRKIKNVFKIKIDDGEEFTYPYLFCVIANSRWYGGGFFSAPKALPDDGLMDFVSVKKTLNRLQLIPLIDIYKKGGHLDWDFTNYVKCRRVRISSHKPAALNLDGEVFYVHQAEFEIIEKAIKFVIPSRI